MNLTALQQRLAKLEALSLIRDASHQSSNPLAKLLNVLVAYHLGGAVPNESIAAGMARGLGYDGPQHFRSALLASSEALAVEDLSTRWRDAMNRLFALKGEAPDCDGPTFAVVVETLFAEMPEDLQRHPVLAQAA